MPRWISVASACGGAARGAIRWIRTSASQPSSSPSATGRCGRPGASTPGCRHTSSACSPPRVTSRWPAASSASGRGRPRTWGRPWPTSRLSFPGRFLLGIGTSHGPVVADYARPYSKMVAYLDALDALTTPVPPARRVLAALGPRMLELAAARTAGAHPYFVPVEHTARARDILGPGPLLAPEVAVVLETDPVRAQGAGPPLRRHVPRPAQLHAEPAHLRLRRRRHRRRRERPADRRSYPLGWGRDGGGGGPRPSGRGRRPRLPPGRLRPAGVPAGRVPGARGNTARRLRRRGGDARPTAPRAPRAPTPPRYGASASAAPSARKARPRWDTASFSAGCISAKVRPSPPSGTNTGS